jgi:hypothetical protein
MTSDATREQPSGPENPRSPAGPDAPAPPGGPQRADRPGGSTVPDDAPEHDPEVRPSGDPEPSSPPTPAAPQPMPDAPDGTVHARSQAEQAEEQLQEENAETSLDQPSS